MHKSEVNSNLVIEILSPLLGVVGERLKKPNLRCLGIFIFKITSEFAVYFVTISKELVIYSGNYFHIYARVAIFWNCGPATNAIRCKILKKCKERVLDASTKIH